MSSDFDEISFPGFLCYGTKGGPEFSTSIVEVASGAELRNRNWTYPRYRYTPVKTLLSSAEALALITFFNARGGMHKGFRFKDYLDYATTDTGTDTGTSVPELIGVYDGYTRDYQLVKTYTSGGITQTRKIVKPVDGTLHVYWDGVELVEDTEYTCDYNTGIVSILLWISESPSASPSNSPSGSLSPSASPSISPTAADSSSPSISPSISPSLSKSLSPSASPSISPSPSLVQSVSPSLSPSLSPSEGLGARITAIFEFDVPVRFSKDYLPLTAENYENFRSEDVELIELKL